MFLEMIQSQLQKLMNTRILAIFKRVSTYYNVFTLSLFPSACPIIITGHSFTLASYPFAIIAWKSWNHCTFVIIVTTFFRLITRLKPLVYCMSDTVFPVFKRISGNWNEVSNWKRPIRQKLLHLNKNWFFLQNSITGSNYLIFGIYSQNYHFHQILRQYGKYIFLRCAIHTL